MSLDPTQLTATSANENNPIENDPMEEVAPSKKRRLTSKVWDYYDKFVSPSGDMAKCKYCEKVLVAGSKHGTTHLRKYIEKCLKEHGQQAPVISKSPRTIINETFDQERSRKDLAHMVIKHKYSFNMAEHEFFEIFCHGFNPNFKLMCRNTVRADVLNVYKEEKLKFYSYLEGLSSRITLTTDIWTSDHSNIAYTCLTAHFINDDWELKKKIITFRNISYPHDGESLFSFISDLILEWNLDRNLFSMVVDNASSNDVMVRLLKKWLGEKSLIHLNGELFHVRCSAHILNLVVQDGLAKIKELLTKIRETVIYLNRSPLSTQKFENAINQCKLQGRKKVGMDVSNRWNSTFKLLDTALPLKEAYARLAQLDKHYKLNPSEEEWEVAIVVRDCLQLFFDTTIYFSGTSYPTSNVFFPDICKIQLKLKDWANSEHECLRLIAGPMLQKFEKYWEECCLVLAIAVVLDPRFKMDLVEFYYDKIYGLESMRYVERVRNSFLDLYIEYGGQLSSHTGSSGLYPTDAK